MSASERRGRRAALLLVAAIAPLGGCAAVAGTALSAAGSVVGAGVSVAGAVVSTGVSVTGKVVGKVAERTVDALAPGGSP